MTSRPVVLRHAAVLDIERAIEWYRREAGESIAIRFVDALETTLRRVARDAGAGSPRYAHELDLAGLRTVAVRGFPQLVFYVEMPSHVEVWRVLHGKRDVPAILQED